MNIIQCEQGSAEWHQVKCGIPSASNFDKIVCLDGKPSKQRTKYLYQLAGERITGKPEETYQNGNMERGKILEAEARQLYQVINDSIVQQVGFCLNESPCFGSSPDSLVDKDGGLEIKCPIISTHVGYLLENKLPSDYFQQVQGNLLVTGRKWWDFMSYYPGMRPLIVRVERDEKFLALLATELEKFCQDLEETVRRIK